MRCSASLEELSAYLDGELDRARAAAVEEHLGVCDACRREVADLRGLSRAMGMSVDLDPGTSVRVGLARRLAMIEDSPEFTCARMQVSMSAMLDDELPPEDALLLEAHLATCPTCAAEMALLGRVSHTVQAIPEVEVPLGLERRIRTAIAREEQGLFSLGFLRGLFQPRLAPGLATAFAGATLVLGFWLGRVVPGVPAVVPMANNHAAKPAVASALKLRTAKPALAVARGDRRGNHVAPHTTGRQPVVALASTGSAVAQPTSVRSKPSATRRPFSPRPVDVARVTAPVVAPPTFAPAPTVLPSVRHIPDAPAPAIETPAPVASVPAPAPEPEAPVPTQPPATVPGRIEVAERPAPPTRVSMVSPAFTLPGKPRTGEERRAEWWRKEGDQTKLVAESLRGGSSTRAMTASVFKLSWK